MALLSAILAMAHISLNKYNYRFEVYVRYMMLRLYREYDTTILATLESPTLKHLGCWGIVERRMVVDPVRARLRPSVLRSQQILGLLEPGLMTVIITAVTCRRPVKGTLSRLSGQI